MTAYYNEIDGFAAQWLRNLIDAGHIAPGDVDERSIEDVQPDDLAGYTQCHFFAGIGVWSHALRLAGWPDDQPVWTGSCPCQPFSAAGKRGGFDDARHLWPAWSRLIAERAPSVVFGEQVASKDGYAWLDAVQSDLEDLDYACGPVVLPAAGFGAPHGRHRIFFVADSQAGRWNKVDSLAGGVDEGIRSQGSERPDGSGESGFVADAGPQREGRRLLRPNEGIGSIGERTPNQPERSGDPDSTAYSLDNAAGARREDEGTGQSDQWQGRGSGFELGRPVDILEFPEGQQAGISRRSRVSRGTHWSDADWLPCVDGKSRPVEPGTFPLAHGIAARVGRLRAYGNAIVAPVAAEFIAAYRDTRPDG